jgi:hypothetical protein
MEKKKANRKCYMCGKPATSKEHVPPLCLFPEGKDIKTSVFRNNLITVPACELHNSKKSKDDEFLMACLAGIVGNNVIGFFHTQTKVKRALERSGKDFLHVLMKEFQPVNIKDKYGDIMNVIVGRPDMNRLHSCFEHISYGLYYHKFGKRFEGKLHIIMDFITHNDAESENYKLVCRKRFELEPQKPKKEGSNPEIFKFEFIKPDEFGLIAMQMTFYEGAKVFVAFQGKDATEPRNLLTELIKSGVRTIVTFPDGSKFVLNENKIRVKGV